MALVLVCLSVCVATMVVLEGRYGTREKFRQRAHRRNFSSAVTTKKHCDVRQIRARTVDKSEAAKSTGEETGETTNTSSLPSSKGSCNSMNSSEQVQHEFGSIEAHHHSITVKRSPLPARVQISEHRTISPFSTHRSLSPSRCSLSPSNLKICMPGSGEPASDRCRGERHLAPSPLRQSALSATARRSIESEHDQRLPPSSLHSPVSMDSKISQDLSDESQRKEFAEENSDSPSLSTPQRLRALERCPSADSHSSSSLWRLSVTRNLNKARLADALSGGTGRCTGSPSSNRKSPRCATERSRTGGVVQTLAPARSTGDLVERSLPAATEAISISGANSAAALTITPRSTAAKAPGDEDFLSPISGSATRQAPQEQVSSWKSPRDNYSRRGSQLSLSSGSPRRVPSRSFPSPWYKESAYLNEACGFVTRRTYNAAGILNDVRRAMSPSKNVKI